MGEKKIFSVRIDDDLVKKLKHLAVDESKFLGDLLEEAIQEIRGYKEILQQQVTILDSSIKKAHSRLDDMDSKGTTFGIGELNVLRKELQDSMTEIEALMGDLRKLEDEKHDEELLKEAKENSPWRKFFEENGKKVLLFVLLAIGLFLLKNFPAFMAVVTQLGAKAAGAE